MFFFWIVTREGDFITLKLDTLTHASIRHSDDRGDSILWRCAISLISQIDFLSRFSERCNSTPWARQHVSCMMMMIRWLMMVLQKQPMQPSNRAQPSDDAAQSLSLCWIFYAWILDPNHVEILCRSSRFFRVNSYQLCSPCRIRILDIPFLPFEHVWNLTSFARFTRPNIP